MTLRISGNVPGIIYGGENENEKISLSKKEVKNLINKENFLSNVISINLMKKNKKFYQEISHLIQFLTNQLI